jgi:hypothetical protein
VLDGELTSKSILGSLVRQAFDVRGDMAWGYSKSLNVALEARALPGFAALVNWPQLLLLPETEVFMFDLPDAESAGAEAVMRGFWECLDCALHRFDENPKRNKTWVWEKLHTGPDRGHFPPRVYTEHRFADFKEGMQFKCRYLDGENQNRVMYRVRRWRPSPRALLKRELGTRVVKSLSRYRPVFVLRDLVKISINILAHLCGHGVVNCDRFPAATAYARYGQRIELNLATNGFVVNSDIQQLGCPSDCHRVVLRHDGHQWICDFAFFDGKLGARVFFPGPRVADWHHVEVTVPYKGDKRDWDIRKATLITFPPRMRVCWDDQVKLMPSIPQLSSEA